MELRITVDDRVVQAGLSRLNRTLPDALHAATEDATQLWLREMRLYPTQRPNSTYRRTETLHRSWARTVTRVTGGVRGEVFSSGQTAPYNIYVQHHLFQAVVHRGRWQTEAQVYQNTQLHVIRFFEVHTQRAVQASGLGA